MKRALTVCFRLRVLEPALNDDNDKRIWNESIFHPCTNVMKLTFGRQLRFTFYFMSIFFFFDGENGGKRTNASNEMAKWKSRTLALPFKYRSRYSCFSICRGFSFDLCTLRMGYVSWARERNRMTLKKRWKKMKMRKTTYTHTPRLVRTDHPHRSTKPTYLHVECAEI